MMTTMVGGGDDGDGDADGDDDAGIASSVSMYARSAVSRRRTLPNGRNAIKRSMYAT